MRKIDLLLSDADIDWIRRRIESGKFANVESYVAALIERDMEGAAELAWLQAEIDKGLASGVDPRPVEQIMQEARDGFVHEPEEVHAQKLARLRDEIDKGRNSGVSERSLQEIYEDYMIRRDAA